MPELKRLLEELANAFGPSGFEEPVRAIMRREMTPHSDEIVTDGIGSLIARLGPEGGSPRVMVTAHMDEVGLMVRYITNDGFVKFQTIGGWLDQALINQRFVILTRNGPVLGVTGLKTPHVMQQEERTRLIRRENIFLDVGARNKRDAEERLCIRPGDPIAPDSTFAALNGDSLYLGKAWDDRVGCAVMAEALRRLSVQRPRATVFAVATVQEEIGLHGARTSSYHVQPDIGINVESGVSGDYPGIGPDEAQEQVGHGPGMFLHDSSMLPNLKLRDFVQDVAKELGIPVQFTVLSGYGQDAAEMQRARGGTPTINISVPTRYLHNHNGIISRSDVDQAITLVMEVVQRLDGPVVQRLRSFS